MKPRGGARPGAGRPPKRVINLSPIRAAEKKIADRLPWLVDKLMELAEGIHEEKMIGDGAVMVYKRAPDRQAAEYLIDRIMGKPTQPLAIEDQVDEIAEQFGVEPERVTSIVERLKAKRAG
jgi:hypothetical protein